MLTNDNVSGTCTRDEVEELSSQRKSSTRCSNMKLRDLQDFPSSGFRHGHQHHGHQHHCSLRPYDQLSPYSSWSSTSWSSTSLLSPPIIMINNLHPQLQGRVPRAHRGPPLLLQLAPDPGSRHPEPELAQGRLPCVQVPARGERARERS